MTQINVTVTQTVTDLYCEGISDPIPFAGTAYDFEQRRLDASSDSGRIGKRAWKISWQLDGRTIMVDLSKTRVIAMVERKAETS